MKRTKAVWAILNVCMMVVVFSIPTHATIHQIDIGNFFFTPLNTLVSQGDTVRWILQTGIHTTTSDVSSPKAWDSGTMNSPGQIFDVVFDVADGPGPFPYHCTFHVGSMKDTIFMADVVTIFGQEHTSLGQASLNDGGGTLTVSNIGSSGEDGVSIDLGEAESFGVEILQPSIPNGAYIQISAVGSVDGVVDQPLGLSRIFNTGSDLSFLADLSPIGSPTYTVEILLDNTLVFSQSGASGVSAKVSMSSAPDGCGKNPPFPPWPPPPPCFIWTWDSPIPITISGGPTILGDQLNLLSDGASTVDFVEEFGIILKDVDPLVITGETNNPYFLCGDADASAGVDIDDVVYLINYIFGGGPAPDPLVAGDADCSGGVDIDDVVYLINYIFGGGNTPCDPDGNGELDC